MSQFAEIPVIHLVTNLLTIAAVLTHAVVGCCWHHDHGSTMDAVQVEGEAESHEQHAHVHHKAGYQEAEHADSHGECPHNENGEPCDEQRCNYVGSGKVLMPDLDFAASLPALSSDDQGRLIVTAGSARNEGPPTSIGFDPARALTQVWRL